MNDRDQLQSYAQQKAAQMQHGIGGMTAKRDLEPPSIPSPSQKAAEALSYLCDAEDLLCSLRMRLYGPVPGTAGQNEAKRADEPSLDETLTGICQRAACVASEIRSILGRL